MARPGLTQSAPSPHQPEDTGRTCGSRLNPFRKNQKIIPNGFLVPVLRTVSPHALLTYGTPYIMMTDWLMQVVGLDQACTQSQLPVTGIA
jgi:hypothetical protein